MKHSAAILLVCALLLGVFGSAGAQDMDVGVVSSEFRATEYAEMAGLGDVTGHATFDSANAYLFINLIPNGAELPEGVVLEGWLVDAGRFTGPSQTNASVADQGYGPPFGNLAFDVLVSAAPYALSTGLLLEDTAGNWSLDFHVPNYNFSPYDGVVITAESDGNTGDWDPRPGAPFFSAGMNPMYADLEKVEMEVFAMIGPAGMEGVGFGIKYAELVGIANMEATPLAANANLAMAVAGGTLYQSPYGAFIDLTIYLSHSPGPQGCLVLEGWVVDAGLLGGPGTSNANDGDEALGLPFDDKEGVGLDAAVEAAPYALSTGVAADNGDGTLSASIFFPGYNLDPYDAFVVTLEGDCNDYGFDPRPGTPVLLGMIEREGEAIEGMRAARLEQSGG